ncbi:hypothetical protein [Salmonella phage vB_StyS-sam]|uniref:Uncharacterized protein n=1 Tax=Salmonella phage vB_StyS-sam TaxID=2664131 RepID=A0A5K7Y9I8_9CAUD|nr:hypothetical protein QA026_gp08 [Salmonella phage vB_StyS-sam]BBO65961.1 hypothetical protein [Salmonella phage vB_StyS-sam]
MESVSSFRIFTRGNSFVKIIKLTEMYLFTVYLYFCDPLIPSLLEPDSECAARIVNANRSIPAILGVGNFPQVAYSVIGSDVIDMVYLFP